MRRHLCVFTLSLFCAFASEIEVTLNDPSYANGEIRTDKGGVVIGEGFYIQGQKIVYTNRDGVRTIACEGDLMVEYQSRVYIGKSFHYDFIKREGSLICGRVSDGQWIMGGDRIDFLPDGSAVMTNAYVTTSEDSNAYWDFHASSLSLEEKHYLVARNVTFRYNTFPIMYFPYYSADLIKGDESPVSYSAAWDSGQGPRVGVRYRAFSNDTTSVFTRLYYHIARGGGGALETKYKSRDGKLKIFTKNFIAHDTFPQDPKPNVYRTWWRLQGILDMKRQENDKMDAFARWDKISDKYMVGHFPSDDFELSTGQRTELTINRTDSWVTSNLYVRPRINDWQGFKQELPTGKARIKPLAASDSGITYTNDINVAYLDYDYSREADPPPGDTVLDNFHAFRIESNQSLSKPMHMKLATLTPYVGFTGIYYNNNQRSNDAGLAIFKMGGSLSTFLSKHYGNFSHYIVPSIDYNYYNLADRGELHYIFSINDGWNDLNLFRVGIDNYFYPRGTNFAMPSVGFKFYSYGFLNAEALTEAFPRVYGQVDFNFAYFSLWSKIIYNIQRDTFETTNVGIKWTVSDRFAFSWEFRHRDKYAWKKDQPENFILDVTRKTRALLESPLSDQRNVVLLRSQVNLTPFTQLRCQGHFGWARNDEPAYQEAKFDILSMITSNWRLRITYKHTVADDQVSVGVSLIQR
ncbi:MAG: hypothetical protein MRY21_07255 [Simkaniaceae bacterium]|nr:hypothetical protein [Simkaniaceae bacterium]